MELFYEMNEVLAVLAPTTANAAVGAHTTGPICIADFHKVFVKLILGEPGAAGSTVDLALAEMLDVNRTGTQLLPGSGTDQLVAADTEGYVGVEAPGHNAIVTAGYPYIEAVVTVGVNTFHYSLVVYGVKPRYAPVDVTGYTELV